MKGKMIDLTGCLPVWWKENSYGEDVFFLRKFSCTPNCIYRVFYNACNLILRCLYLGFHNFPTKIPFRAQHIYICMHIAQIVVQYHYKCLFNDNVSSLKLCSECPYHYKRQRTHFLCQVKKFIRSRPSPQGLWASYKMVEGVKNAPLRWENKR